ncbi:MAG: DUF799 domain-containing protein [Gammaproteobacteria bacterium]
MMLLAGILVTLAGCATPPSSRDYTDFRSRLPRSILVMPPLNESTDVNAPYIFLATITRPLANQGYYVFPVAMVDAYMKENGLPSAYEMQNVPLEKIHEVFGADAVLYVTILDWGQKYLVLTSNTVVKSLARLVDVRTGQTIWSGQQLAVEGSSGGGGGLIGMAIAAVVDQIIDSLTDRTYELSRRANDSMVYNRDQGLLLGPYHPEYAKDSRGR